MNYCEKANFLWHFQIYSHINKKLSFQMKWMTFFNSAVPITSQWLSSYFCWCHQISFEEYYFQEWKQTLCDIFKFILRSANICVLLWSDRHFLTQQVSPNFKPFKQLSKCSKHLNAALTNSIFIRFSFHFCGCHQSSRNITFKTGFVKNSR